MKQALFGFASLILLLTLAPVSLEAAPFPEPAPSCSASNPTELEEGTANLLSQWDPLPTSCEPDSCMQSCASGCGCPGSQGFCTGNFCLCQCLQCAIEPIW
jgi:hypothetical protein